MFVSDVKVTRGSALVFVAQVDFTISENPAFRFSLPPGGEGALRAEITDTDSRRFESTHPVTIPARD